MLKCLTCKRKLTYIGYTKDLYKRINLHNSNKGAKFTKGNNWKLIYSRKFTSKSKAMSYEYQLKNDRVKRLYIYKKF